ncbi:MAG: hypothetical protein L0K41_11405, partial [Yaniella sp.]|nr:hypothetical protein [Yaniella sp.]
PSETVNLYFKVTKEVQPRDLVATIVCFDADGTIVRELESPSYSTKLSRHYIYLRPPQGTVNEWVTTTIVTTQAIKRVEIEISHWANRLENGIEDVLLGVWAGESLTSHTTGGSVNFVAI